MKVLKAFSFLLLAVFLLVEIDGMRDNKKIREKHSTRKNKKLHVRAAASVRTRALNATTPTGPSMTTTSAYMEEEVDVICTRKGAEDIVQNYVLNGKLSGHKILPLTYGTYSDLEIRNKLQTVLAEANLPSFPPCKNGKIIKEEDITESDECKLDVNLNNFTQIESKLRQMEEAGIIPLGTADNATSENVSLDKMKRKIMEAEITAGRLPSSCLNQTAIQTISSDSSQNRTIPSTLKTPIEKGENGPKILKDKLLELKTSTTAKDLKKTRNNNANVFDPQLCTPEGVKRKIEGYVYSGQLELDKIFPIILGNYTKYEIGMLLNETLIEAGLPSLPTCDTDLSSNSSNGGESSDECTLGLNGTNLNRSKDEMKELEEKGYIPVGTTEKALGGEMSFAEVKNMITKAKVAAGRIPPSCLNPSVSNYNADIPGEINHEDMRSIIMQHLPKELRNLIEEGKMPKEIEDAIFSGTHSKSEIMKLIVQNDEVLTALLPSEILDLLQGRPIPKQLKLLLMSGKNETELRKEIESNDEILKELFSPGTYYFYKLFQLERSNKMYTAASYLMTGSIIVAMLTLGCSVSVRHTFHHVKRIRGVVVALFVQYILMPAVAFGLIKAFGLKKVAAIAMLVCACCPGGNLFNILVYLSRGDINLSILMTTCSSLFGFGLMPLAIFLYSRLIFVVDTTAIIPYHLIARNMALTVLPTSAGVAIRYFCPERVVTIRKIGVIVFLLLLMASTTITFVLFGNSIFIYFPTSVLGCCIILPMFGYIAGYLLSYLAKENDKCRRSISIQSGSQNAVLCATVLQLTFQPEEIGVLFLAPIGYMFFQSVEGSIIVLVSYIYERRNKSRKSDQSDSEEKKLDVESEERPKERKKSEEQKPFVNRSDETKKMNII